VVVVNDVLANKSFEQELTEGIKELDQVIKHKTSQIHIVSNMAHGNTIR